VQWKKKEILMKETIDEIVGELLTPPGDTGLVVGVSERGHSSVYGYGEKQGASSGPPRGDTLFEIGSVTKVFTTSLLSLLVSKCTVSLDDPVHEIFSTLPGIPPEITLLRLATHIQHRDGVAGAHPGGEGWGIV
jgi:CubicO group peptidase (beta-lactamase class C family)